MSLQEAAEARKAKLAALKKRKTLHDSGNPEAAADSNDKSVQPLSRSSRSLADLPWYTLQTRSLSLPQL